jgi:hypothetical protein
MQPTTYTLKGQTVSTDSKPLTPYERLDKLEEESAKFRKALKWRTIAAAVLGSLVAWLGLQTWSDVRWAESSLVSHLRDTSEGTHGAIVARSVPTVANNGIIEAKQIILRDDKGDVRVVLTSGKVLGLPNRSPGLHLIHRDIRRAYFTLSEDEGEPMLSTFLPNGRYDRSLISGSTGWDPDK